jgi:hypothetical protein
MSPKEDATFQAKALVEKDKKDRTDRCAAVIDQILKAERCSLEVAVLVTARGNVPQLTITAQD